MINKHVISLMAFIPFVAQAQTSTILINDVSTIITSVSKKDDDIEVLHNKDVLIVDGVINKISDHIEVKTDKTIEGKGKILQAGFVDTHDHLWQVDIRSCGNEHNLYGWIRDCDLLPAKAQFTKDEAFAAIRTSTYDLINTGVTTVMDWNHTMTRGQTWGGLDALQQSGLRYVMAFNPSTDDTFNKDAYKLKSAIDKDPLGHMELASHPAIYMEATAKKAVELAKELKVSVNFHYLENRTDDQLEQHTKVLKRIGADKVPLILNHVVHPTDDEIAWMKDIHAKLTHNALSNMRLASGVMPLGKLHKAGLTVGLGLDGAANDNADFFTLMKATVGLQRASHEDPTVYPSYKDVELLATIEGAKVLGLESSVGTVEVGKQADLILLNPNTSNMGATWDSVAQVTLEAQPRNVEMVMVAGKILKENGKVIITDEPLSALLAKNKQTVERFKTKYTKTKGDAPF
ncbi:hypothetical protein E2R68_13235 [Psychromonas sp. RZ22]|uniref:amidohydrolase family protein n=1 Tax=Psychromonas algarum TaxID=2555643 RepID=UPI001067CB5E|nr:amidohydrolase family protein [Psychromonas sp. RZ22]TEW53232.1 hypothetical protein E2R68_13235 [Psychromonas sp. RZ22]